MNFLNLNDNEYILPENPVKKINIDNYNKNIQKEICIIASDMDKLLKERIEERKKLHLLEL